MAIQYVPQTTATNTAFQSKPKLEPGFYQPTITKYEERVIQNKNGGGETTIMKITFDFGHGLEKPYELWVAPDKDGSWERTHQSMNTLVASVGRQDLLDGVTAAIQAEDLRARNLGQNPDYSQIRGIEFSEALFVGRTAYVEVYKSNKAATLSEKVVDESGNPVLDAAGKATYRNKLNKDGTEVQYFPLNVVPMTPAEWTKKRDVTALKAAKEAAATQSAAVSSAVSTVQTPATIGGQAVTPATVQRPPVNPTLSSILNRAKATTPAGGGTIPESNG